MKQEINIKQLFGLILPIYLINIASFINIAEEKMFSRFDLTIFVIFVILVLSFLILKRIRALYHQIIKVYMVLASGTICYSASIRHAQIIDFPINPVYGWIILFVLIGLSIQIPYYYKSIKYSLDVIITSKKIDTNQGLWNTQIKTPYVPNDKEKKVIFFMKKISWLSYLAPGLGMITSRNLNLEGDILLQVFMFLIIGSILILGLGLPIAEYLFIKYFESDKKNQIIY